MSSNGQPDNMHLSARYLVTPLLLASLSAPTFADDLFLHPHCFDAFRGAMFSGEGVDASQPLVCDPELLKLPVETHTWENNGEQQTSYSSDNPEDPEFPGFNGFNSYAPFRIYDTPDGGQLGMLELMFNTGGSGHFGLLAMVEKDANGEAYPVWWQWAGDRCNDGYPSFIGLQQEQLFYSVAATPFRLLNPLDETDWRMQSLLKELGGEADDMAELPTLGGWKPYDDLANCAACCAGERVYAVGLNDGFSRTVGVKLDTEAFLQQQQGEHQVCINEWLSNSEFAELQKDELVSIERWLPALKSISEACSQ